MNAQVQDKRESRWCQELATCIIPTMAGQTFGDWLRRKRGVKGRPGFVSQEVLGKLVGVDRTHINKIETGTIGFPDDDLRNRIHAVFDTSDADLEAAGVRFPVYLSGAIEVAGGSTVQPAGADRPPVPAAERYRRLVDLLKQADLDDQFRAELLEETIKIYVRHAQDGEGRR